jgi:hypothetical protein
MMDIDKDKLVKVQAIKDLGGLSLGSHYSNYPLQTQITQKCQDVLFTWGPHFIEDGYFSYPHQAIYKTGYISDHYFNDKKNKSDFLRKQYPEKFILSYHDNVMANDLPYSCTMQLQIHQMIISLLLRYKILQVFLKPKRRFTLKRILKELPELQIYIDEGRITVFYGDTPQTKMAPAEIGMASDLVLGLGISTAAAECCFSGTVSFHADLTGFNRNSFANNGDGKIVFRDIISLKKAIERQITGGGITVDECREYHRVLDPFQDGQAYKRISFVMKRLQESLDLKLDRIDALKHACGDLTDLPL